MTHNELVKFAAGKVNVLVAQKKIYERTEGDEDVYKEEWFEVDEHGEIEDYFDLTSPDLLIKGLEALQQENGTWLIYPHAIEMWLNGFPTVRYFSLPVRAVSDVPLLFWQCWAELEGGQG